MKKMFFILSLSLMATGAFANNDVVIVEKGTSENVDKVCCRRGASNSDGENVSVRACVDSTGDAQIDMGKACEKAKAAVIAAIDTL